jgi:NAD(P)H dehydrogenase (quinone)
MKRVLIGYESRKGHIEKMAHYIAEGVRLAGNEAMVKAITTLKSEDDLKGYDAYFLAALPTTGI